MGPARPAAGRPGRCRLLSRPGLCYGGPEAAGRGGAGPSILWLPPAGPAPIRSGRAGALEGRPLSELSGSGLGSGEGPGSFGGGGAAGWGMASGRAGRAGWRGWRFRAAKRGFDLGLCLLLLPALLTAALLLVLLNPFANRGPLFFVQERMGQGCRPFRAWKFRTMASPPRGAAIARGAFDALDAHRITPLGRWLRRSHLDELPQVLNVLRGEMSLIGPRPDYLEHARIYLEAVPGYRERHQMRPGISGYAQIELGYAAGLEGVRAKVGADLHYVRHASLALDLRIAARTLLAVLGRRGS